MARRSLIKDWNSRGCIRSWYFCRPCIRFCSIWSLWDLLCSILCVCCNVTFVRSTYHDESRQVTRHRQRNSRDINWRGWSYEEISWGSRNARNKMSVFRSNCIVNQFSYFYSWRPYFRTPSSSCRTLKHNDWLLLWTSYNHIYYYRSVFTLKINCPFWEKNHYSFWTYFYDCFPISHWAILYTVFA